MAASSDIGHLVPGIVAMRTFVPARNFDLSLRFYATIGFTHATLDDDIAHVQLGTGEPRFAFMLQRFYSTELAENLMMHLLVHNLDDWWAHIETLDLARTFGVKPPRAPSMQPWGIVVGYVWDPSGVLWHFAQYK